MAPERLQLTLDLGPSADIQSIAAAVDDIGAVCMLGSQLQRVADRNQAAVAVVTRAAGAYPYFGDEPSGQPWLGGLRYGGYYLPTGAPIVSRRYEQAVAEIARQSWDDSIVRVEQLTYRNPLELVIIASGVVVLGVIKLIRDWPARRRLNEAAVADYENAVRARERTRQIILDGLATGEYVLTSEQIDTALTPRAEDAFRALADAEMAIQQIEAPTT